MELVRQRTLEGVARCCRNWRKEISRKSKKELIGERERLFLNGCSKELISVSIKIYPPPGDSSNITKLTFARLGDLSAVVGYPNSNLIRQKE